MKTIRFRWLVSLIVLASLLGPVTASAAEGGRCHVIEAGASGPADNVLRLNAKGTFFDSTLIIAQRGVNLSVRSQESYRNAFPASFLRGRELDCGFETLTTSEIDRIDLLLPRHGDGSLIVFDMSRARPGWALAPGATREQVGPEIEIRIVQGPPPTRPDGSLGYIGTKGTDRLDFGAADGVPTVNFNPGQDGDRPDHDILPGISVEAIRVAAGPGRDYTRPAIRKGLEPLPSWVKLAVQGDDGDDELIGHSGPDALSGGTGNDLIRALGGDDRQVNNYEWAPFSLVGGPGRDRIHGGAGRDEIGSGGRSGGDTGADFVFGGPGDDTFHGQMDGFRDRIDCGPGKEKKFRIDRGVDVLTGCEMAG